MSHIGNNTIKLEAKVISMVGDNLTEEQKRRYLPRNEYLMGEFVPKMTNCGFTTSLFPAITPQDEDFLIEDSVVTYRNHRYTRGKNRQGELASTYQIALTLGHLMLWEESIAENKAILILEDDVYLPKENEEIVKNAIEDFLSCKDPRIERGILYLQSTCPWRSGKPKKEYAPWALMKNDFGLFRMAPTWNDTSGTAAYLITPSSASFLAEYVRNSPLWTPDGMFDDAKRCGAVDLYLPKEYTKNFELHPIFA
jgi:GR25 family glycosyltransferase involved in LPS biosynthesis